MPQFILISSFCVQVDGDDEAVETEDFCENEDEDHSDEESRLLCGSTDAGIADDAIRDGAIAVIGADGNLDCFSTRVLPAQRIFDIIQNSYTNQKQLRRD